MHSLYRPSLYNMMAQHNGKLFRDYHQGYPAHGIRIQQHAGAPHSDARAG